MVIRNKTSGVERLLVISKTSREKEYMAAVQSPFLIGEAVHGGWQRAKERLGYFIVLLIASVVVVQLPNAIGATMPEDSLPALLLALLGIVVSIIFSRGMIRVSVEEARNQKSSWESFKATWQEVGWYFLASVVYTLIIFAGILLLIVPGIYWSLKYQYMLYLVVDKKMGIRESMAASAKMTDGVKWDLIGFGFVTGIINILGFLALLLGLFMTVPATMVARAKVYDRLLKRV